MMHLSQGGSAVNLAELTHQNFFKSVHDFLLQL